jgi:hypothetical protein
MRRPNPVSDRSAGNRDPDQARPFLRRDGAMKNVDGNDACGKTDQPGQYNKPPVMLAGQAGKDTEHLIRSRLFFPTNNPLEYSSR